jgi:hypothetical protein
VGPEGGALAQLLGDALQALQQNRALSRTIVAAGFLALGAAAVAPTWRGEGSQLSRVRDLATGDGAFVAILALVLLVCRAPLLAVPHALNLDEAQLLAQAMRALLAPVPWVGVDPTTSGPLNSYALVPPLLLGAPASYAIGRTVALGCWIAALVLSFATLRQHLPNAVARLAVLPAAFFVGSATATDYVHYSSEHVSILLLAVAVFFGSRAVRQPAARGSSWVAGLVLGSVPFAKLQAAPVAVTVGALLLWVLIRRDWPARDRRRGLALGLGSLTAPLAILGWVAAYGGLTDFWRSYVDSNLHYASQSVSPSALLRMSFWGSFPFFWLAVVGLAAAGLASALPPWRRRRVRASLALGVAAFLAASLFVIATPGKGFPHYLLLLVIPLTWLAALALANLPWSDPAGGRRNPAIAATVVVGLLGFQLALNPNPITGYDPRASYPPTTIPGLVSALRALAREGDTLAVWGWMPQYYPESGLPPATRHAISYFAIEPGPHREHYRTTLLEDLRASQPLFVLEAVGRDNFRYLDRAATGIATFPGLAAHLDRRYCVLRDRPQYRLFLRRDAHARALEAGARGCPGVP